MVRSPLVKIRSDTGTVPPRPGRDPVEVEPAFGEQVLEAHLRPAREQSTGTSWILIKKGVVRIKTPSGRSISRSSIPSLCASDQYARRTLHKMPRAKRPGRRSNFLTPGVHGKPSARGGGTSYQFNDSMFPLDPSRNAAGKKLAILSTSPLS